MSSLQEQSPTSVKMSVVWACLRGLWRRMGRGMTLALGVDEELWGAGQRGGLLDIQLAVGVSDVLYK